MSPAGPHLHYASWIYTDHGANSSEGGVFLLIVSYISQRGAPDNWDVQIQHQTHQANCSETTLSTINIID